MAVVYFTGFETGDASNIFSLGTGAAVQNSIVRTGAYALQQQGIATILCSGLNLSLSSIRAYIYLTSYPTGFPITIITPSTGASGPLVNIQVNSTGNLGWTGVAIGLPPLTGLTVLALNTWYRVECSLDRATSGQVSLYIDGTLELSATHSVVANTADRFLLEATVSNNVYFDDIVIRDSLTPIGAGQCIARQGISGTPSFDAWSKNGAATAALCWSDTPFSTATNCTSSTSGAKQTMLIAPFSQTQNGRGTQVVGSSDTVNAAKTALVGKRAASGSPSIIRIINGTETDTAAALIASDAYFDDGIWTTTPANLDLLEAGCLKASDANLTTIEDMWVMVDYTPGSGPSPPPPPAPSTTTGAGDELPKKKWRLAWVGGKRVPFRSRGQLRKLRASLTRKLAPAEPIEVTQAEAPAEETRPLIGLPAFASIASPPRAEAPATQPPPETAPPMTPEEEEALALLLFDGD